jgi:hypothetical protein
MAFTGTLATFALFLILLGLVAGDRSSAVSAPAPVEAPVILYAKRVISPAMTTSPYVEANFQIHKAIALSGGIRLDQGMNLHARRYITPTQMVPLFMDPNYGRMGRLQGVPVLEGMDALASDSTLFVRRAISIPYTINIPL